MIFAPHTEVGIYKRKQVSKKTRTRPRKRSRKQERKQELDQESDQENKEKNFFFLIYVEVFVSYFLTFLFSFINSHLCTLYRCLVYSCSQRQTRATKRKLASSQLILSILRPERLTGSCCRCGRPSKERRTSIKTDEWWWQKRLFWNMPAIKHGIFWEQHICTYSTYLIMQFIFILYD